MPMITKLKSLLDFILGNKEKIESDRYFLIITCFTGSIFLLILCAFHIIESLSLGPVFIAAGASIAFFLLYYFLRFRSCFFFPKLIMTIAGLVMLDFTWYLKFLSTGPVLMFILVFGALVIWVWYGKQLIIMMTIYFLNIIVLFIIEELSPASIAAYPDPATRTTDIYLSFFFYASLMIFILLMVKKEYISQKDKAVKSDQLKSAFLANMSHEIRTPLNSIMGFTQLLRNEEDKEKKSLYLDIIGESSDNLLSLITDLIDLSKIEIGETNMNYSSFSIEEMFIRMKDVYSNELWRRKKGHVKISYVLAEGDYIMYSDPTRLKQILANLLSNAIKFTSKGEISFSCKLRGNDMVFIVKDTGAGIKPEVQNKIFDQFKKFDHDGINSEGTGIGLSIVDKIITLLDGEIWLESTFGIGTSFFFSIPYKKGILNPESSNESIEKGTI